ncbi:MAG: hypothetical protein IPM18_08535 [Phycisphaerales bacterium]|nr:hypothetical protein [Phycisphaerales bacterium]
MLAHRRNTVVVIALVASMTLGVSLLYALEQRFFPERTAFRTDARLTAELPTRFTRVAVHYAHLPEGATLRAVAEAFPSDDTVLVLAERDGLFFDVAGSTVHLVVLGTEDTDEWNRLKLRVMRALDQLSQSSGVGLLPVQLTTSTDDTVADRGVQVSELVELLRLKQVVR